MVSRIKDHQMVPPVQSPSVKIPFLLTVTSGHTWKEKEPKWGCASGAFLTSTEN